MVIVSEISKRSDKLGALVVALPLVTLLVLFWMHFESQSQAKIANHAWYTFWYVILTLPMFAMFPYVLPRLDFWLTMLASIGITLACFIAVALLARTIGVNLQ